MTKTTTNKITVLLADDHVTVRAGIRAMLDETDDIEVIGEAQDGFEVQELVPQLRPRILLLDLKMPGPRPAELERWTRENFPDTETLVLTAHDRDGYLASMMDAGVTGYLSKNDPKEKLIGAIRRAAGGIAFFDAEQIKRAQSWRETVNSKWESLTMAEQRIAKLVAQGEDTRAIAGRLSVTSRTIEFHVASILKKLELPSRQKMMAWMHKNYPDELEDGSE